MNSRICLNSYSFCWNFLQHPRNGPRNASNGTWRLSDFRWGREVKTRRVKAGQLWNDTKNLAVDSVLVGQDFIYVFFLPMPFLESSSESSKNEILICRYWMPCKQQFKSNCFVCHSCDLLIDWGRECSVMMMQSMTLWLRMSWKKSECSKGKIYT